LNLFAGRQKMAEGWVRTPANRDDQQPSNRTDMRTGPCPCAIGRTERRSIDL
ncbi:hypothetical protein BgiMline_024109, partial [Biomphalaria glabrata]